MVFIWKNEDVPWQFTGGYLTSFDINKGMQHARFVLKIRLWRIDTVPLCVWTFGTFKVWSTQNALRHKIMIGNSMSSSSMYQWFHSDFVSCKDLFLFLGLQKPVIKPWWKKSFEEASGLTCSWLSMPIWGSSETVTSPVGWKTMLTSNP